jgi:hypothetical protein
MRASDVRLLSRGDCCELQATITGDALGEPFLLWYRFPAALERFISANDGDFLIAALLLPAMKTGEPIEIPVPISPMLYRSAKHIETLFQAWDATLTTAEVRAPLRAGSPDTGDEVGLFFSLGVDSHYSLWKNTTDHPLNDDIITQLIIVHGADLYLGDEMDDVFAEMASNTQMIADRLDKGVVNITTNVANILSALGIRRGFLGHETILASVGLALQGIFKKIYVASGSTYTDLAPSNAHPLLTPLWSTERCLFVCDGLEAGRLQKTMAIAQSHLAMDTLRVCWVQEGKYNCGRCAKCIRTMLALHIAGALAKCRTLPHAVDTDLLRKVRLVLDYDLLFMQEILDALGCSDADADIRAALLEVLTKWRAYFERLEKARKNIDRLILLRDRFILVDRDTIRWTLGAGRAAVPFLERDGQYWGTPLDDETAIREMERLREDGAKFMVLWWSEYWWLEHYAKFGQHVRSNYRCLLEDDSVIVFALGGLNKVAES